MGLVSVKCWASLLCNLLLEVRETECVHQTLQRDLVQYGFNWDLQKVLYFIHTLVLTDY